jgi:hypothetical protein
MVQLRRKLSASHLIAADCFAKQCDAIEKAHSGHPTKTALEEDKAYAIAAVVSSVAFLETSINELYDDAAEGLLSDLEADQVERVVAAWSLPSTERLAALEKHQLALILAGLHPFDEGAQPFQDAQLLVRLRNRLVHSKAEWLSLPADPDTPDSDKLARALQPKFQENALMSGSAFPFFPEHCLGAGCANWAVNTAVYFFADFSKMIGIHIVQSRGYDTWRFRTNRSA